MEINDRETRRQTFDQAAHDYEAARPGYPEASIAALVAASDLSASAKCLEVGVGTGQATRRIAPVGCAITGLEPGPQLAQVAETILKPFPAVQIVTSTFEAFDIAPASFDLLYSATAFHWTSPAVRWDRAAALVKPGGHVALLTNKSMEGLLKTDFHEATQPIYARHAPERADKVPPGPSTIAIADTLCSELEDDPRFEVTTSQCFGFNMHLGPAQVCQLQMTFSDHLLLSEGVRAAIHKDLKALVDNEFGGEVIKPYETALVVARRL